MDLHTPPHVDHADEAPPPPHVDDLDPGSVEPDTADGTQPHQADGDHGDTVAQRRSLLRRGLRKYAQLSELDPRARGLLAAALGTSDDDVEGMTLDVMTGTSVARNSTLDTLVDLAEASPIEVGVMATTMERSELKAVFEMLGVLDAGGTKTLSTSPVKAALAVAEAAQSLGEHHLEALATAKDASRRTV